MSNPNEEQVNLEQWDEVYAETPVEERSFDEIPDGKYQAYVHKVELKNSQAGNPMLSWDLIVLVGQHKGRHVFKNSVITTPENLKFLKTDLHTCGVALGKASELKDPAIRQRLLDVQLDIQVKTNGDFKNVYLNRRIATNGAPVARNEGTTATNSAVAAAQTGDAAPWAKG